MTTSVYPIYRATGRAISFKGLTGPYILLAAAGLVGVLFLFVFLYCCQVPVAILVPVILGLGAGVVSTAIRLSRQYGPYGLQKFRARRRAPLCLRCRGRHSLTPLKT